MYLIGKTLMLNSATLKNILITYALCFILGLARIKNHCNRLFVIKFQNVDFLAPDWTVKNMEYHYLLELLAILLRWQPPLSYRRCSKRWKMKCYEFNLTLPNSHYSRKLIRILSLEKTLSGKHCHFGLRFDSFRSK